MGRCLAILAAVSALVAVLTSALPRIAPPGGPGPGALTGADYLFMCGIPIGAFFAGRHWYRHELFLLYGGFGLALFLPAFLADDNNYNRKYYETTAGHDAIDAILHDTAGWTIAIIAMAVTCMLIARWGRSHYPARRQQ